MSKPISSVGFVVAGATYPIELLLDADSLVGQAAQARHDEPPDERNIPRSKERANARAAIFTAFNFLESLLLELAQDYIRTGSASSTERSKIEGDISKRRGISTTYDKWTKLLFKKKSSKAREFANFEYIRDLRNQLVHPKLVAPAPTRTQDELIRVVTADLSGRIVAEVSGMAKVWYVWFGKPVPPEISERAARVGIVTKV